MEARRTTDTGIDTAMAIRVIVDKPGVAQGNRRYI